MVKLYLLQHGLALDKSVNPERPLSDQGRNDVQKIAGFLKTSGVAPAQFFHSGKTRAQQTAQLLASALGDQPVGVLEQINPNDALQPAIRFISQLDEDTMLVGHLPFMQRLVSFLLCNNETTEFSFQPGATVCLCHNDASNNSKWSMQWMLCPDLLPTT